LGEYAEWYVGGSVENVQRLGSVKRFLSFLHRQGLTKTNLSTHVKLSRSRKPARQSTSAKVEPEASLTREGYVRLQSRLEMLKEERGEVVKDIQRAMADKDFRENAPLDAARERQGFIEGHIQELERILASAVVADRPSKEAAVAKVNRSSKVTLSDIASGRRLSYALVDPREADPTSGKISFVSPVGQALLGHSVGEEVSITVPRGTRRFRIEKVES
jgi:transcription elongation factor GreA